MSRYNVADVMTNGAVSVSEDATYRELVDVLEARRVGAVPVVDSFQRVLGVVSATDLMYRMEFAGGVDPPRLFESRHHHDGRHKAAGDRATELMSVPAVTVPPTTSVVEAARLMESTGVKRLPVVDDLGRLIGMVTRRDLLRVFMRTDAEITTELTVEILPMVLGYEAGRVQVEVCDGAVTLTGEVADRSEADLIAELAERVDGVISVTNRITSQPVSV